MVTKQTINDAMDGFDNNKGVFYRLFGDPKSIKAVKTFSEDCKDDPELSKDREWSLLQLLLTNKLNTVSEELLSALLVDSNNLPARQIYDVFTTLSETIDADALKKFWNDNNFTALANIFHTLHAQQGFWTRLWQSIWKPARKAYAQKVFDDINNCRKPQALSTIVETLKEHDPFTESKFDDIKTHNHIEELATIVENIGGELFIRYFDELKQHQDLKFIANAVEALKTADQLANNFVIVLQHENPVALSSVIVALGNIEILDTNTFNLIQNHPNLTALANIVDALNQAGILRDIFESVISYRNLETLNSLVNKLKQADILNLDILNAIINHEKPDALADAFVTLKNAAILDLACAVIKECGDPVTLANYLVTLKYAGILEQVFDVINEYTVTVDFVTTRAPDKAATDFVALLEIGVLSADNCKAVNKDNFDACVDIFRTVDHLKFLTQERQAIIQNHENFGGLIKACVQLKNYGSLNDSTFRHIIGNEDPEDLVYAFNSANKDFTSPEGKTRNMLLSHPAPKQAVQSATALRDIDRLNTRNLQILASSENPEEAHFEFTSPEPGTRLPSIKSNTDNQHSKFFSEQKEETNTTGEKRLHVQSPQLPSRSSPASSQSPALGGGSQ